ncbi:MAG: hypothetical protein MGG37_00360 [Trichodesmium sp. MAG_R01]|nr:hypothetical protein [Trichodesmium sp. MAG_R01]
MCWAIQGKLARFGKTIVEELPALQKLGIGAIVLVMDDPSNLELYRIYQNNTVVTQL